MLIWKGKIYSFFVSLVYLCLEQLYIASLQSTRIQILLKLYVVESAKVSKTLVRDDNKSPQMSAKLGVGELASPVLLKTVMRNLHGHRG